MSNFVHGPEIVASVSFGNIVRLQSPVGPAGFRRPFSDGLSMRFPAAANDHAMGVGANPLVCCSPLFWLDLIEVDGHVLLAAKFDGDLDAFRAVRREFGAQEAELAVNTVFLDELFDTDKYPEDKLIAFGTVICESLRARAARIFPNRTFVTELFSVEGGNQFGVRLYQGDCCDDAG